MNTEREKMNNNETKYKVAIRIAWIAGIFTLVVLALMLDNYVRRKSLTPGLEENLLVMKNQLQQSPENTQLQELIRQLDRDIRLDRMRWLGFSQKGVWLLLFGAAVLVGSLKYAESVSKSDPEIGNKLSDNIQVCRMVLSRRSVAAGVLILIGTAGMLALKDDISYIIEDDAITEADAGSFYDNWPAFRGPYGSGVYDDTAVPLKFDIESGENVLWKSPVPMDGMNSPVVWGDRIFMAGGDDKKLQVYCYDANSGKLLWSRDVQSKVVGDNWTKPMSDTGYSAPTMTVDGKCAYVIFATGDIAAFDFDGREVWSKNLGGPDSIYGYASSLTMFGKLLIVQYDQGSYDDDLSKMIALDGFSGQVVWQTKRPVANSWSSPVVIEIGEGFQLITTADPYAISYDPETGKEIWRAECVFGDIAPISIYAGGLIMAIEPYNIMAAIRPDGSGNVTETHIAWKADENIPDICSPVATDKYVFLLGTEGMLTCHNLEDGKVVWEHDFETMFQASPSIVGGRLVLLSEKGEVIVADPAAEEYTEISRSKIGEKCFASPAFAPGKMFIRSTKNLFCIGSK